MTNKALHKFVDPAHSEIHEESKQGKKNVGKHFSYLATVHCLSRQIKHWRGQKNEDMMNDLSDQLEEIEQFGVKSLEHFRSITNCQVLIRTLRGFIMHDSGMLKQ